MKKFLTIFMMSLLFASCEKDLGGEDDVINVPSQTTLTGNINATGDVCITGGNCLSNAVTPTTGKIIGTDNETVVIPITLTTTKTVIFTAYGMANYTGGSTDIDNAVILFVNSSADPSPSACAIDENYIKGTTFAALHSSATCIEQLAAGSYNLTARQIVLAATRRNLTLSYTII